jgi:hypothetical protein
MNLRSHFRFVLTINLVLASCGPRQHEPHVAVVDYSNDRCWKDTEENLSAFLVIDSQRPVSTPYLVSSKCFMDGHAVLEHLNERRIVDSYHAMQNVFPETMVRDSFHSEEGTPDSQSRVYYLKASFTLTKRDGALVVSPTKIISIRDTGVGFEKFLGLSEQSRTRLAELNSGNTNTSVPLR